MLNLARCRSVNAIQSAPLIVDQMVLMYRNDVNLWPWRDALERVFKPLGSFAWVVVILFGLTIISCMASFVCHFAPKPLSFPSRIVFLFNHPNGKWPMNMKVAWGIVVAKFTIYFAMLILMYEISVAVAVFRERPAILTDIGQLSSFEANKIGVTGGAALESCIRSFGRRFWPNLR